MKISEHVVSLQSRDCASAVSPIVPNVTASVLSITTPNMRNEPKRIASETETHHFCPIKRIGILVVVCGMLGVCGCASIVSGTKQTIKITSSPDAANVKVERLFATTNSVEWEGKTPATVKLWRKGSFLVTVWLPGYQKAEIPISAGGMNGWVWGNIGFGGIIGIIIDSSNGAAEELKPEEIDVKLVAIKTVQTGRSDDVYAVVYAAARNGKTQIQAFPLKPMETN